MCLAQPKSSLVLHTHRGHCPKERVQKDNRRHFVGYSVSSALDRWPSKGFPCHQSRQVAKMEALRAPEGASVSMHLEGTLRGLCSDEKW